METAMFVVPTALLAVFAWLAYLGVSTARTVPAVHLHSGTAADGAIAIARERLAAGEIEHHDYERIVAILQG